MKPIAILAAFALASPSSAHDNAAAICAKLPEVVQPFVNMSEQMNYGLTALRLSRSEADRDGAATLHRAYTDAISESAAAMKVVADLCQSR